MNVSGYERIGWSETVREIDDKTIEILDLVPEVQEIMHGNSSKTEIEYRLAWTRTYMKKVGILENSLRGVWSLTTKGRELSKQMTRILVKDLPLRI